MKRRVYIETSAALRRRVEDICRAQGYVAPILCTPDELMEDPDER